MKKKSKVKNIQENNSLSHRNSHPKSPWLPPSIIPCARPHHIGPAGVHVSQQMCSHHTLFPSTIMMQLQRPYSLKLLPHQQQFQHRLRCSNGQLGSGHLGSSGLLAAVAGLPSKLGGIGYAIDCAVRLRHGLRLDDDEEDDDLPLLPWCFFSLSLPLLLLLLLWCFLLLLSFLEDFDDEPPEDDDLDDSAGASAQ